MVDGGIGDDGFDRRQEEDIIFSSLHLEKSLISPRWSELISRAALDLEGLQHALQTLTQDLRLGNLTQREVWEARLLADFASDSISFGLKRSATLALIRLAHLVDLSQSRHGFLRRNMRTWRREETIRDEPQRRSLFGFRRRGDA